MVVGPLLPLCVQIFEIRGWFFCRAGLSETRPPPPPFSENHFNTIWTLGSGSQLCNYASLYGMCYGRSGCSFRWTGQRSLVCLAEWLNIYLSVQVYLSVQDINESGTFLGVGLACPPPCNNKWSISLYILYLSAIQGVAGQYMRSQRL
jgi:hypothetical protein